MTPEELPPLRNIQHHIKFISRAKVPNIPHDRMSPKDHDIFQGMVEDLSKKTHVTKCHSPCASLALLVPKKR